MKGDYTRFSHDPAKHYTGVLRQQGRLDLDADWNEHVQIVDRLEHIEAVDVIGRDGRPKRGNGFAVAVRPDGDLVLEQGHMYVGGTLCENEPAKVPVGFNSDTVVTVPERTYQAGVFRAGQLVLAEAPAQTAVTAKIASIAPAASGTTRALTLDTGLAAIRTAGNATIRPRASYRFQPALPSPAALAPAVGQTDLLYLDVWQRHVTALEDADILEPALRGPDTTTRLQTVWQLRVKRVAAGTTCEQARAQLPGASGGRLTTRPATVAPVDDPCFPTPGAGSGAIDNRLYRVEVHSPSTTPPTFKWSRDNGSVAYPVEGLVQGEAKKVKLARMGRDQVLALAAGDFVEIVGDEDELAGTPGLVTKVDAPPDVARRIVTLHDDVSSFAGRHHLKLRRWDHGVNPAALLDADGATKTLDPGVEVQVGGTNLRVGDWWTFTTRAAAGASRVEQLDAEAAEGGAHAYAPLALITWAGSTANWSTSTVVDCRPRFPALTEICADDVCYDDAPCSMGATTVDQALDKICGQRALRYVSGDGQEGKPNTELGLLQVGVEDGLGRRVSGWQVQFERISGDAVLLTSGGATETTGNRTSDANGLASTRVRLGPATGTSIFAASLTGANAPQGNALRILFRVVAENPPASGGKCTVTLGPGDSIAAGVQQLVSDSPSGGELCLRAGVYEIESPEEITKVHAPIRITGTGPGTVLKAEQEAALVFTYCSHIEISNLRVEGGGNAAAPGDTRIGGALTFLACKEVSVTGCELLCSEATSNARACVTVEPASRDVLRVSHFTLSATIKDNDFEVAAWQTGVLLANVRESLVEGNRLRLRTSAPAATWTVGPRPQLTQSFADMLVEALDPEGNLDVNVDSLPQLTLRFRRDGRTEQILREFGRLIDVASMRGGPEAGLRRFATRVMNDELGGQFTSAGRERLTALMHKMRAVDSGIVIGGSRADSVKVIDNFVSDAVRGIRVATADIEAERHRVANPGPDKKVRPYPSAKRAGDVLIRGNTIKGRVPEMFKRDRYAVMVGNADAVTVAETFATTERTVRGLVRHATPIEGVRLYGQYGPFISVDRTSLRGFKTGVRLLPTQALPKFRMWSVSKTMVRRGTAVADPRNALTHSEANVP